ncbi:MAG: MotA/TolQ/ExbB proton channel family protein [Blastocatellia bacterium]|nr:MotA/TolQ/ExbB proton channel family protein [Blastocatellia bacterium]
MNFTPSSNLIPRLQVLSCLCVMTAGVVSASLFFNPCWDDPYCFSLRFVLVTMSWFDLSVRLMQYLLFFLVLSIVTERLLVFEPVVRQTQELLAEIPSILEEQQLWMVVYRVLKKRKSHLASLIVKGLYRFELCQACDCSRKLLLENVTETLQQAKWQQIIKLRSGLELLKAVATTAPVIGMLGTVVSILNLSPRFSTIGMVILKSGGMPGITVLGWVFHSGASLAFCIPFSEVMADKIVRDGMLTTLLGLAVGVPSLWLYHHFLRRIEVLTYEMEWFEAELLRYCRRRMNTAMQQRLVAVVVTWDNLKKQE